MCVCVCVIIAIRVTLGCGRLGQLVVNTLLQSGFPMVRVLVRPNSKVEEGSLQSIFPQADRIMAGYTGVLLVPSHSA